MYNAVYIVEKSKKKVAREFFYLCVLLLEKHWCSLNSKGNFR